MTFIVFRFTSWATKAVAITMVLWMWIMNQYEVYSSYFLFYFCFYLCRFYFNMNRNRRPLGSWHRESKSNKVTKSDSIFHFHWKNESVLNLHLPEPEWEPEYLFKSLEGLFLFSRTLSIYICIFYDTHGLGWGSDRETSCGFLCFALVLSTNASTATTTTFAWCFSFTFSVCFCTSFSTRNCNYYNGTEEDGTREKREKRKRENTRKETKEMWKLPLFGLITLFFLLLLLLLLPSLVLLLHVYAFH